MDENIAEWKSIGKGADICTNDPFVLEVIDSSGAEKTLNNKEDYCLYYEDLKPLTWVTPTYKGRVSRVEPSGEITQTYKTESEKYSYILIQHFNDDYELLNDVLLRFELPESPIDLL